MAPFSAQLSGACVSIVGLMVGQCDERPDGPRGRVGSWLIACCRDMTVNDRWRQGMSGG